jgi:hypothetical protein
MPAIAFQAFFEMLLSLLIVIGDDAVNDSHEKIGLDAVRVELARFCKRLFGKLVIAEAKKFNRMLDFFVRLFMNLVGLGFVHPLFAEPHLVCVGLLLPLL